MLKIIPKKIVRTGHCFFLVVVFALALALTGCARGSNPAAAESPQLPAIQFVDAWGTRGTGPGQIDVPVGIATDTLGHVYIADAGATSIEKFTAEGGPLLSFGDAWIEKAAGIAVDRGGGIYVAEGSRVQIFWPEGDRLRVTYGGSLGATGVAVDADGNYYVSDRLVCRVTVFDIRGRLMRSWGRRGTGNGEFRDPSGVAIGADGSVYVADAGGARVQKFTNEGVWLASFGAADASSADLGARDSVGLAVSARAIFVVGGSAMPLRVWTLDGQETQVDPAELAAGEAAVANQATSQAPTPLRAVAAAIDSGGDLLLLDAASDRVLRFHIHL